MSKNIVKPKSVSFEDALRNLASRLTGQPANLLPRTQEGVVQFMAENAPSFDEMAEAITQEVLARLSVAAPGEDGEKDPDTAQQEANNGPGALGGTPTPGKGETPNVEAPVADGKPKRGSKAKTAK